MTTPAPSPIPGVKMLIIGRPGAGKTYSTRTIFAVKGLQPVHLFLEQSQSIIAGFKEARWHFISPMPPEIGWDSLRVMARNSNTLAHGNLQESGVGHRRNFTQFLDVIETLNKFVDDRTGEELGDVMTWGTDHILVLDGLSGLTAVARYLRCGLTPLPPQSDYGVVQSNIETLLALLTQGVHCHVVLIAHIEREPDIVTGALSKTVSTMGKKLGPKIPAYFDDVVIAEKKGKEFFWTTVEPDSDTKNRNLPLGEEIPQDFAVLISAWEKNGGVISAGVPNGGTDTP